MALDPNTNTWQGIATDPPQPQAKTYRLFGYGFPTLTMGAGAPVAVEPSGSLYLRTDGTTTTSLYVSTGNGVWTAK